MMLRHGVFNETGGFDAQKRIESDKKFFKLIKLYYGEDSVSYIKTPLAIGLYRKNSLTTSKNSGFDSYGYSASRNLIG